MPGAAHLRLAVSNGILVDRPEPPRVEEARCPRCDLVFASDWYLDRHPCQPARHGSLTGAFVVFARIVLVAAGAFVLSAVVHAVFSAVLALIGA